MGMDVYGKNPNGPKGDYLRQSIWGWRPLWEYACDIGKLNTELRQHGHNNDGAGLTTQEECDKLANALQSMVDSGHAKAKEEHTNEVIDKAEEWNSHLDALHKLHKEQIGDKATAPVNYEEKDREIYERIRSLHDWDAAYPFREEWVKELIDFLRECGGFEIR